MDPLHRYGHRQPEHQLRDPRPAHREGDRAAGVRGGHDRGHRAPRPAPDQLPGGRCAVPEPAVHGYRGARIGFFFFFWLDGTVHEPSNFYASGAVISTLKDLTAFYRALIGGEVLTSASLAELGRPVQPGAPGVEYGLGITAYALSCGGKAWGRNGAVPSYLTQTLVTKDGRHASVVTNAHLVTTVLNAQMVKVLDTTLCESRG
ncbi:serine hydrolase [Streptomyces sp. SID2119]|uniref:serine hydrolase n=1 Tax=Streptomyces sp. SID2119 TaxID=2690253 RepID=UPI001F25623A|nr:serine hydrolase [Streptomyces sp. SID2119]